jgi:hypothetical protein
LDVLRRVVAGEPYRGVATKLTFEGVTVNAEMRSDGALNDIRVLPRNNRRDVPGQFAATFEAQAGDGSEIKLVFPKLKISARPAMISYLRAGYLAAFAAFGYSAVARRSYDRVRQQIREPDVEHINRYFFCRSDASQGHEVLIAVEPEWHSSIVVLLGSYRIILPLLDDTGLYERIAQRAADGVQGQIQCRRFGWPTWPHYAGDSRAACA